MSDIWLLVVALVLDLAFGEPGPLLHPVVWLGQVIRALASVRVQGATAQLAYGAFMVVVGLLLFVVPTWLLLFYLREQSPIAYALAGGYLLKATFSIRTLLRAAEAVRRPLANDDLAAARAALRSLVSRDTSQLSKPLLAAAAVESVAENTSDSFVAPLLYFVVFGVPGAMAYRVVNTFDSMIGYHGEYEYLGKAAARLDDLLNLIPARLTGLLLVFAAWAGLRRGRATWDTMLRFHAATESPNAGWPMSAMAGALDVQLVKVDHYRLGGGLLPMDDDTIRRATEIAWFAIRIAALLGAVLLAVRFVYFP